MIFTTDPLLRRRVTSAPFRSVSGSLAGRRDTLPVISVTSGAVGIHAKTSTGFRYVADVAAKGDPGYGATAVMLGESVLSLAMDGDKLPPRAGVLTPATGIGMPLIDRLRAQGFTFAAQRTS